MPHFHFRPFHGLDQLRIVRASLCQLLLALLAQSCAGIFLKFGIPFAK